MIMNILIEEIKNWNFRCLGSICGAGPLPTLHKIFMRRWEGQ